LIDQTALRRITRRGSIAAASPVNVRCEFAYPSGAEWVNVFDHGYAGSVVASTYCAP
jgi:hypothetical protein